MNGKFPNIVLTPELRQQLSDTSWGDMDPCMQQYVMSGQMDENCQARFGQGQPVWADPREWPDEGGGGGGGVNYPFEHPIEIDVVGEMPQGEKPVLSGPDDGSADGLIGILGTIGGGIVSGFSQGLPGGPNILEGAGEAIGGIIARQLQGGVQTVDALPLGPACWLKPRKNGQINRRARVRLRRLADGSTIVEKYCAPRRMNPLNARALGRAARRLGMFHNIAAHIEKTVQKACRSGIGRRRLSSAPRYCGPRKRCR